MELIANRAKHALSGTVVVPGDKSISHRSLMFGAIADGRGTVTGMLEGEDCLATAAAMRAMGVAIERTAPGSYVIDGVGMHGLTAPSHAIDLGNSGTGMRLLTGLLAAQSFSSRLVGDESLTIRPMGRIIKPLSSMGAEIGANDGCAPLRISPATDGLRGIRYPMPIASAQVKSAILLAGLYADGETYVVEPGPSRDHTERMLTAMGADVRVQDDGVKIAPAQTLRAQDVVVPGDLSSAAFFLVAGSIVPGSDLILPGVGVNPTRTGVIDILRQMGADLSLTNARESGGEPVADIRVRASALQAIDLDPKFVPLAIDEFPVLFVAAACASGRTRFSGLAELRHKESDRIGVMVSGLRTLGIDVSESGDTVEIDGGTFGGGRVDSHGDHRIAMAFAVAATVGNAAISIEKPENIATSFPNFVDLSDSVGFDLALEGG
ncbi:MAG: 3-phosphoshikimate 1-carboxyvinyltransferase [Pseudomonadota bacterium]